MMFSLIATPIFQEGSNGTSIQDIIYIVNKWKAGIEKNKII